jgi:hypothetical protein
LANRAVIAVEACDRSFFEGLGRDVSVFVRVLRTLRDRTV